MTWFISQPISAEDSDTPQLPDSQNVREARSVGAVRSLAENTPAGTDIGSPVTVESGGTVAYSLAGADAGAFDVVSQTGQLRTKAGVAYDFETKDTYEVTVRATDSNGTIDIAVTVALDNVIELASAVTGPSSVSYAEGGAVRVASYSASSPQDSDGVSWALSGADANHFSIDGPPGALRFHIDPVSPLLFPKSPDFEDPDDSDADNDYELTLQASVGIQSVSRTVTVGVVNADESGTISLSSSRPILGSALSAMLIDPDPISDAVRWQWERSTGRGTWTQIAEATSASYTPVAADTNSFLRVTATYADDFDTAATAQRATAEVVIGPRLVGLSAETALSAHDTERRFDPSFDTDTLHYRIGCAASDTMTLNATGGVGTRISADGVQVASGESASVEVTEYSTVAISVADRTGAQTTYSVHCVPSGYPHVTARTTSGAGAVLEDLMMMTPLSYSVIVDHNAVPRFLRRPGGFSHFYLRFNQLSESGEWRFSQGGANSVVISDANLDEVRSVTTTAPLATIDGHDHRLLDNGDVILLAYEPDVRDLSDLSFTDSGGSRYTSMERMRDSAIQVVAPDGTAKFTWNSWGNMPLEDCKGHRFPDGYAHVNSVQMENGHIIASFRGCGKILALDPDLSDSHKVAWRLGQSNLSDEEWAARGVGPAPLDMIGDPEGEFCGQHAAQILPNGHLVMFDNGAHCVLNPWTDNTVGRTGGDYSRAVEYALDLENHEAVFVRDHSFNGLRTRYSEIGGHIEPLDNGHWLISWGAPPRTAMSSAPTIEVVTQVDPDSGQEIFGLVMPWSHQRERATVVPAWGLAPVPETLEAVFAPSSSTRMLHAGITDAPTAVVAFNRPVADFAASSPSLGVEGATITAVSPHVVAGEQAHAYLITLAPLGEGAITLRLAADMPCSSGGICAADGTTLADVPGPLVISPPVTVSFGASTSQLSEGQTLAVAVRLSAAYRGAPDLAIPVTARIEDSAAEGDFALGDLPMFVAGETVKSVAFEALSDGLVEGDETVTLEFGPLPVGVSVGTIAESAITLSDADEAQFAFTVGQPEVAEGGTTDVTFTITNGVTFEHQQEISLAVEGSAVPGSDFTLDDVVTLLSRTSAASTSFMALDDADVEPRIETVVISATLAAGSTPLGTRQIGIPPSDVPDTPVVTVASAGPVVEGGETNFVLSRTGATSVPLTDPLTVRVMVTASGSAQVDAPAASVTFAQNMATAELAVSTSDNNVVGDPGAVSVLLRAARGEHPEYLVGIQNRAEVSVIDNDEAAFTVTAGSGEIAEGGTVVVTIETVGIVFDAPQVLSVEFAGDATANADFSLNPPIGLWWARGSRVGGGLGWRRLLGVWFGVFGRVRLGVRVWFGLVDAGFVWGRQFRAVPFSRRVRAEP